MTIVAIVGPTASGKTGLAVEVARRYGAEIVGVDASQVYQGLDIGTGKATAEELGDVVHHGLNLVAPNERFDVAEYVRRMDRVIADILGRGQRVVLCGGTGLYLRGLTHGLCQAPPTAPSIKATLVRRIEAGELGAMHGELGEIDPRAAARIDPNDKQRIERALGVYLTTGRALSSWQQDHGFAEVRYDIKQYGIRWPVETLRQRIERRVDEMLATGWLAEVEELRRSGFAESLQSMQALGYRFLSAYLDGQLSLEEAREKTIIATRRYAKRQMKWFKAVPEVTWIDGPVVLGDISAAIDEYWS